MVVCVDNGDAVVLDIDTPNDHQNVTTDMAAHACKPEKLSPVELAAK